MGCNEKSLHQGHPSGILLLADLGVWRVLARVRVVCQQSVLRCRRCCHQGRFRLTTDAFVAPTAISAGFRRRVGGMPCLLPGRCPVMPDRYRPVAWETAG